MWAAPDPNVTRNLAANLRLLSSSFEIQLACFGFVSAVIMIEERTSATSAPPLRQRGQLYR